MPITEVREIKPGAVKLSDHDIVTPGESSITKLVAGDGLELVSSSGADPGTGVVEIKLIPVGDETIPFIAGLRVVCDSLTQCTIGVGQCADSTDTYKIDVPSALTVTITTSGAGGLDTGSEAASTWYAVFVISDSTGTNSPVGLFSLSATSPTLPSGYDIFRRVGWVRNNASSDFRRFEQQDSGSSRLIRYQESLTDLLVLNAGGATSYTDISLTSYVPTTSEVANLYTATISKDFFFRPDGSSLDPFIRVNEGGALIFTIQCPSQIIEYEGQSPAGSLNVNVLGYLDDLAA
jgi:hypothetical protein